MRRSLLRQQLVVVLLHIREHVVQVVAIVICYIVLNIYFIFSNHLPQKINCIESVLLTVLKSSVDPFCYDMICALDSLCCDKEWDRSCAEAAKKQCHDDLVILF